MKNNINYDYGACLGAIIGDVVGSTYEFHNVKTKDFDLITDQMHFTDDTVLTIAVMDYLLNNTEDSSREVARYLKKWARKYPYAGYGERMNKWMRSSSLDGYKSIGNGAAMRISPVGWILTDNNTRKRLCENVTNPTHNTESGNRAAKVVTGCIDLALKGADKKEIEAFIKNYYTIDFDYNDLVRNYRYDVTCDGSVPQALYCFLISRDFEDCLRNAISIGGDSDTIAAIACSVAEAYYKKIPDYLIDAVINTLDEEMIETIQEFQRMIPYKCDATGTKSIDELQEMILKYTNDINFNNQDRSTRFKDVEKDYANYARDILGFDNDLCEYTSIDELREDAKEYSNEYINFLTNQTREEIKDILKRMFKAIPVSIKESPYRGKNDETACIGEDDMISELHYRFNKLNMYLDLLLKDVDGYDE